jgi:hypothetical protein
MRSRIPFIWFIAVVLALSWGLVSVIIVPNQPFTGIVAGIGGAIFGFTALVVTLRIKENRQGR